VPETYSTQRGEEINLLSNPALRDEDGEEKNFLRPLILRYLSVNEKVKHNKE